jgi:hypothetical protein
VRGNRECPPRPSLKIIESSLQVDRRAAKSHKRKKESIKREPCVFPLETEHFPALQGFAAGEIGGEFPLQLLTQTSVTPTPSEELARAFYNCLEHKTTAYSLKVIGAFAWQLPQRFGSSTALDDVAMCMLASHNAIVRGACPSSRIDPKLYNRALRSVQDAINSPDEWGSSNTLCAILLLQRIEVG